MTTPTDAELRKLAEARKATDDEDGQGMWRTALEIERDVTDAEIKSLLDRIAEKDARIAELSEIARHGGFHTHIAGTKIGKCIDECAGCGLDIRHLIHWGGNRERLCR
jgi:hypothetical protein